MQRYNPKDIEPKWQAKWLKDKIYEAEENSAKPKKYILEYFPYPSGAAMHVGHVRNYTIGDAVSRYARMNGFNVLHPMGWDAFGLPAENYAIKTGISSKQAIAENTTRFKKQLMQMGFGYDWSREFASSDPEYYKWTQWFFLLLYKRKLAYQKESLQWWCPVDKTVLANEQVENGVCWRCGSQVEKKSLNQWFFKITDYADRLVSDLDEVDWTNSIKNMQRNWIGRSTGAEINFAIEGHEAFKVFTTRPDTIFGATFMVLAPEHPLVEQIKTEEQKQAVDNYIQKTQNKSDIERQETNRQKTGVFTGAYAINPANNEKIPVWIADYVLYGYGTGAIMAVPAHDERDHEFAKQFDLPIVPVVTPIFKEYKPEAIARPSVVVVIHNPDNDSYCVLDWHKHGYGLEWPGGGMDEGETIEQTAKRECAEETGYTDIEVKEIMPAITSAYYPKRDDTGSPVIRRSIRQIAVVNLKSPTNNGPQNAEEYEQDAYEVKWLKKDEILARMKDDWRAIAEFVFDRTIHVGEGSLLNSGQYDNLKTEEAREKIVADLEAKGAARTRVNYKLRDWLISRQRYWGAPIPMIHCQECGTQPVPEDQLPVELPDLVKFEPSGDGRSPLANIPEFVNTTCPKCGGAAQRETDTMDGFACSSWYFLRFADPHNSQKPFDAEKIKYWLPVDDYIGGAEHAVMHLLYARMWTKVMQDEGLIDFGEPFKTLRNQGMILAPDGNKMSKSKGNTIEPDSLLEQGYGADAIRIMELFIGPWNQSAAWSVEGMGGSFRFLQRIWTLCHEFVEDNETNPVEDQAELLNKLKLATHLTIKKVSEDIDSMSFNTAIAALMEFVNELYKIKTKLPFNGASGSWKESLNVLIQLLAPFAPHISEELWSLIGHNESVHISKWPNWAKSIVSQKRITIAIQVNGKLRGTLDLITEAQSEDEVVGAARSHPGVVLYLEGKEIKKTVYIAQKLINFVV